MKRVFCILAALTLCLSLGLAFAAEEVISFEEFMGIEGAPEAVLSGDEGALEEALEQENVISFEEFISIDGVLEAVLSGDEAALEAILEQAGQPAQPQQQYTEPGVVPQVEVEGEQRVFDLAGLFTETERQQLEERIAELRKDIAPYDAAVLTADNGVYDTQDYADRFYEDHGIGTDENRSGVLFFLDMQNRTMWISTAGDFIGIINDRREQEIFYAQDYYLGNGDWAGAMMVALDKTEEFVVSGVQQGTHIYDESTGEIIDGSQYTDLHDSEYYRRQAIQGVIRSTGFGGIFGVIAGFITRGSIKSKYGKKYEAARYDWQSKSALKLTANSSAVTNKFVTTRVIPRNNNNNSGSMGGGFGGGGSGIHMSSGGMSHGGGGHKF